MGIENKAPGNAWNPLEHLEMIFSEIAGQAVAFVTYRNSCDDAVSSWIPASVELTLAVT